MNELARFAPGRSSSPRGGGPGPGGLWEKQAGLPDRAGRGGGLRPGPGLGAGPSAVHPGGWTRCPRGRSLPSRRQGALLDYLYATQKTDLSYLHTLRYYATGQFLELDPVARRNLELAETIRGKEKKGSLLWVLDKTKTAMGGRLLRSWMDRPSSTPWPSPVGWRRWAGWWTTP